MKARRVTPVRRVARASSRGGHEYLVIETTPNLVTEHRYPDDKDGKAAASEKSNELVAAGFERTK